MERVAPYSTYTRMSSPARDGTVLLALLLDFPTIGLEQLLHTSNQGLFAQPLYQVLHWLSDGLLALPLALFAVWGGRQVAARLGVGASNPADLVLRAGLIGVLFAVVLVPAAAVHGEADRLTHVYVGRSTHSHTALVLPQPDQATPFDGAAIGQLVVHGLGDGFAGQAIAMPLMLLAMWQLSGATKTSQKGS